jgi:hypothetical protein
MTTDGNSKMYNSGAFQHTLPSPVLSRSRPTTRVIQLQMPEDLLAQPGLASLVAAIVVCLLATALLPIFLELLLHVSTALARLLSVAASLELLFNPILPGLAAAVLFPRVTLGPLHDVLCIT